MLFCKLDCLFVCLFIYLFFEVKWKLKELDKILEVHCRRRCNSQTDFGEGVLLFCSVTFTPYLCQYGDLLETHYLKYPGEQQNGSQY